MNETEFNQKIDDLLIEIEDAIEDTGADIDYETVSGILTLIFEDKSQVIINRQVAMGQVWVAAKSGGYHLDWVASDWVTTGTKETLVTLLNRVCQEQSGETVEITLG
ncbi:iron donor protein CyaY [Gammaproteobacteria bacterium 45_16_T64]|nr:iron donor protein CyaY [Gammaproteobacteria bacterium 45_16_T64]